MAKDPRTYVRVLEAIERGRTKHGGRARQATREAGTTYATIDKYAPGCPLHGRPRPFGLPRGGSATAPDPRRDDRGRNGTHRAWVARRIDGRPARERGEGIPRT